MAEPVALSNLALCLNLQRRDLTIPIPQVPPIPLTSAVAIPVPIPIPITIPVAPGSSRNCGQVRNVPVNGQAFTAVSDVLIDHRDRAVTKEAD